MMQAAIREQVPKRRNPASDQTNGADIYRSSTNNSKSGSHKPRLSFFDVRVAAYGRWEYIHSALGVKIQTTDHRKHTACPGCGGKDRFRVMAGYSESGRWFCGGGGDAQSSDGFGLLQHVHGWTPAESLNAVADILGISEMDNSAYQQLRAQAEKQAAKMAEDADRKHEQARRTRNLKTMLEDMLDAIADREYLQRITNKINGRFVCEPSIDEVATAHELNTAILEAYAGKQGVDYA